MLVRKLNARSDHNIHVFDMRINDALQCLDFRYHLRTTIEILNDIQLNS